MEKLYLQILVLCVVCCGVLAGSNQFSWDTDTQHEQNRLQDDEPLRGNKGDNQKNFLETLYSRMFGKSSGTVGSAHARYGRDTMRFQLNADVTHDLLAAPSRLSRDIRRASSIEFAPSRIPTSRIAKRKITV